MRALFIIVLVGSAMAQPKLSITAEFPIDQLPCERRVTNDGIYAVASFDARNDVLYLSSYYSPLLYAFHSGRFHRLDQAVTPGCDFILQQNADHRLSVIVEDSRFRDNERAILLRGSSGTAAIDHSGTLTMCNGDRIDVTVPDRSTLRIAKTFAGAQKSIELHFPNNLGYANCLGIDADGTLYVIAETYLQELPLRVDRWIYSVSPSGTVLSILKVPIGNQLSLVKEFITDGAGGLSHLFATRDAVILFHWSGLNSAVEDTLRYPPHFYEIPHRNEILPVKEAERTTSFSYAGPVSRKKALWTAEQYVLYAYNVRSVNLAPQPVTAPDGTLIQTPSWLVAGANVHIPYKWGGFSTVEQFSEGLANGLYAGDIHNEQSSVYAVGVDCSGFVSRCWDLPSHHNGDELRLITSAHANWDSVRPGDYVQKIGHARMFIERSPNGAIRIAESGGVMTAVTYQLFSLAELTSYWPQKYSLMIDDMTDDRPVLHCASALDDTTVILRWSSDTTGLFGYRLYRSVDGTTWSLSVDEDALKCDSVAVVLNDTMSLFRVSRIVNGSSVRESQWSNIHAAYLKQGRSPSIIIDGYNEENGSWEGPGHPFVGRYATSLYRLGIPFESANAREVTKNRSTLTARPIVVWFTGDGGIDVESISPAEQNAIAAYLLDGGKLFISGSEIGFDLWMFGSGDDNAFYTNFLRAAFRTPAVSSTRALGAASTPFEGLSLRFGQYYPEDGPDQIDPVGGSIACMVYANGTGAGVMFSGTYAGSTTNAKMVYLGFTPETIADDSSFTCLMEAVKRFFDESSGVSEKNTMMPNEFSLGQNYPNPFNPTTTIRYALPNSAKVTLAIYDLLGREIETLVNEEQSAGWKEVQWNANNFASGIYLVRMQAGKFAETKKVLFLK